MIDDLGKNKKWQIIHFWWIGGEGSLKVDKRQGGGGRCRWIKEIINMNIFFYYTKVERPKCWGRGVEKNG
jgi:hypothetical protein